MKKLRWPITIVILALTAIGVLLLTRQSTLPPAIPEEIQPVTGGVYIEALVGKISRLNPLLDLYNPSDHDIDRLIYSSLVRFDDRGLPLGDLAESWGISMDGTVYNFSIREEALWHDGKPVTSEDIIFTVEMMRSEESIIAADVRELWNSVEVISLDAKTIQFRLPEPFAPFMDYLTFGIVPQHVWGGLTHAEMVASPFNLQPVGSGPYYLENLNVEDGEIKGLVLRAFQGYYGKAAFIEQIVFQYLPDSRSALEAYRRDEVMGISRITTDVLPDALKEPNLRLYTGRLPELSMIFINLDNPDVPFLADVDVRRALFLGLNRQWMIDNLLDGQAILADGPVFPNTWAYYDGIEQVQYAPDEAVALLKRAGYTIPAEGGSVRTNEDGLALRLELVYPDNDVHAALAETIQSNWEKLGVEVSLIAAPYEDLLESYLEPRLYQLALIDLNLVRSPDPDPYPFWHQTQITGGQNYSKWDDFQVSEYLEQGRVIVDIGERTKNYRNFQVRFTQELPALPLFYPVYVYGVDAEVQGVQMGPLFDASDRFSMINSWYLVARRSEAAAGQPVDEATPEESQTTGEP
jgi:peptide/nickel transport system substrate-binding protein